MRTGSASRGMGDRETPGLYRDVMPAWSDPNLKSLIAQVKSPVFLAHVRASTGTATSRNNCHPFAVGRWSFMHNGQIGGYDAFRRDAEMMITDALYPQRKGATDSEALFLVALGLGLDTEPKARWSGPPRSLRRCRKLGGVLLRICGSPVRFQMESASTPFAMPPMIRPRPCSTAGPRAAREGPLFPEPLEIGQSDWEAIPPNSFCTFEGADLTIEPFAPQVVALAAQ